MKDNEETNILRNMPGRWVFVQIFCGSFAKTTPQTYFYYRYNLAIKYYNLSISQDYLNIKRSMLLTLYHILFALVISYTNSQASLII